MANKQTNRSIHEEFARNTYKINLGFVEICSVEPRVKGHMVSTFVDRPLTPIRAAITRDIRLALKEA